MCDVSEGIRGQKQPLILYFSSPLILCFLGDPQCWCCPTNIKNKPDGLGFGMSHSMVTLMFESSLQAVNPKLSVPYWDFTIEAYIVDTQHDGDYTKLAEASELWTPGWFGGSDSTDFQVRCHQGRRGEACSSASTIASCRCTIGTVAIVGAVVNISVF